MFTFGCVCVCFRAVWSSSRTSSETCVLKITSSCSVCRLSVTFYQTGSTSHLPHCRSFLFIFFPRFISLFINLFISTSFKNKSPVIDTCSNMEHTSSESNFMCTVTQPVFLRHRRDWCLCWMNRVRRTSVLLL